MKTAREFISYAEKALKVTTEHSEIQPICRIIFNEVMNWSFTDLIMHCDDILSEEKCAEISEIIRRLSQGEPVQYVVGHEMFCGMTFKVNRYTLIPRPETAGLADMAIERSFSGSRILDIGTGSGCIAVTIAKRRPDAAVYACDISTEALATAAENAAANGVNVNFFEYDITEWKKYDPGKFDIIVSNPPYVAESDMPEMTIRVTGYEPHTALFVPDSDPLVFYRHIAQFGESHLNDGGEILVEINERFGEECAKLFRLNGYACTEIYKDIYGKDRFISAKWTSKKKF